MPINTTFPFFCLLFSFSWNFSKKIMVISTLTRTVTDHCSVSAIIGVTSLHLLILLVAPSLSLFLSYFLGKVVFSWANMIIILFLEPRFVKYEKHLLMWKLISVSCTLSRLYFFYRNCPSRYPGQQPISARAEIEPVVLCKIKY